MGSGLLTPGEAAALLGLAAKTIYDHASRGRIPCVRLYTGQPRFEPLVVEALRAGVDSDTATRVADAVRRGVPEAEVRAIWLAPAAAVIGLGSRRRRKE